MGPGGPSSDVLSTLRPCHVACSASPFVSSLFPSPAYPLPGFSLQGTAWSGHLSSEAGGHPASQGARLGLVVVTPGWKPLPATVTARRLQDAGARAEGVSVCVVPAWLATKSRECISMLG